MFESGSYKVFSAVAMLILVLILTYYVTKYIARFMGGAQKGTVSRGGKSAVSVPGRVMIGKGQGLITVRYDGREYLVGVTDHQFTVIAQRELTPEELEPETDAPLATGFSDKLVKACAEYAQKKKNEGK